MSARYNRSHRGTSVETGVIEDLLVGSVWIVHFFYFRNVLSLSCVFLLQWGLRSAPSLPLQHRQQITDREIKFSLTTVSLVTRYNVTYVGGGTYLRSCNREDLCWTISFNKIIFNSLNSNKFDTKHIRYYKTHSKT